MLVVTGGAGFVGSHLLKTVQGRDFSLRNGQDVRDAKKLLMETVGADAVVHLAAETDASSKEVDNIFGTNVIGTLNVLEACRTNDIGRVVFASSAAVYGEAEPPNSESVCCEPINPYGASKLAAESLVSAYSASYGISATVLRFFNIYGPGCHGVIPEFIRQSLRTKSITMFGDGMQTRDFIHVDDVVRAIELSLDRKGFDLHNVGTGLGTSIRELADKISGLAGGVELRNGPARETDITHSFADTTRASEFGFRAEVGLDEGLGKTFRYFRK
jgi:UDP-glucose 4-epimerase